MSIYLSYNYDQTNSICFLLNSVLTGRLALGHRAIKVVGFSLFGNEITWVTGRYGIERTEEYFFVDCAYLNIALTFGVIVLFLVILGFVILGLKAFCEKKCFLCIVLIIISIHSFSDPQLLDLKYNPLLIILGTAILKRRELPLQVESSLYS